MLTIQQKHIRYNYTNSNTKKEYIVIHDTGNSGRGANANAHFNYFDGGDRQASANYFVDDSNILELVDPSVAYAWHCGDGRGKYGIINSNSIGIETCVNSDGNYVQAIQNTLDLTVYLMKKFGIDINHVIRHYDASRKNCPAKMNADGNWSGWISFKNRLASIINAPASSATGFTLLKKGSQGDAVKNLQSKLNQLGYGLSVDGDFGSNTYNAVVNFQSKYGLDVDGVVGQQTISKLNTVIVNINAGNILYRVQVGAYSVKSNADNMLNTLKNAGFDGFVVQINNLFKVQVGAYSIKSNADNMLNSLKSKGFDGFIVKINR